MPASLRGVLNFLYALSGWLAGGALVVTLLLVASGILLRPMGWYLRGADDYAAYAVGAAGFFALTPAWRAGAHIRITVLVDRLKGGASQWWARAILGVAALTATLIAWSCLRLPWQSWMIHDVSPGVDATPLWIPQLGLAGGAVMFALAVWDSALSAWRTPGASLDGTGEESVHGQ